MNPVQSSRLRRRAFSGAALVAAAAILGLRQVQARPADPSGLPAGLPAGLASALQQVSIIPSACRVAVSETIAPVAPRICDEGTVEVSMAVTCPTSLPIHLVIAVDRSKSIADPPTNPLLRDVQQSARQVLDAIDFDVNPEHKVGVLSHGFRVTVETELTSDPGRANGAINSVRYLPSDLGEDPAAAINKAMQLLKEARAPGLSPIEVILLYGDGCDPSVPSCPAASKAAASRAAGEGAAIMTVCYKESPRQTCASTYRQMASEPGYYFESRSAGVPRKIEELLDEGRKLSLGALTLAELLGPDILYQSASGTPMPTALPPRLNFLFSDVKPGESRTAQYRVKPGKEGTIALREAGSAISLKDSLDRTLDGITVPTRDLDVGPCIVETATPSASPSPEPSLTPSASPTDAASRTPSASPVPSDTPVPPASATPVTRFAYLPLLMRQVCRPAISSRNYVILVMDASNSMDEISGAQTKIVAAKAAALAFVDLFDPRWDQMGLVPFNSAAADWDQGSVWPTEDFGKLRLAIGDIRTAPGTRIDLALEKVQEVMREMRMDDLRARFDNIFTVVMTDGRPSEGTTPALLERAAAIKAEGMRLYAVGLGADIDRDLLRQVSSGTGYYLEAPSADDLGALYRSLAVNVGCPGGVMWGEP